MGAVLDLLKGEVDETIKALDVRAFEPDPIAGKHFSKITSVMSSAYKRHGNILERSILEALRLNSRFSVWRDDHFQVPATVDHIVGGNLNEPSKLHGIEHPYGEGDRTLQIDVIVVDTDRNTASAYEIKRGFGWFDSGKRRSMLRDTLAVQLLLKSYAIEKGHEVGTAHSYVVFYYGKLSLHKPFALAGSDLDEHFGCEVRSHVEEVNAYYQNRLFAILSGAS